MILLRSILESSYAVFSIDFIVIYTFINYLNKFSLKTKMEIENIFIVLLTLFNFLLIVFLIK